MEGDECPSTSQKPPSIDQENNATLLAGKKSDPQTKHIMSLPQEHNQLWSILSQIPRKAQRGLLMQCDLILTCVDVTDDYIALGSNIGLVFLYNREKQTMERLKSDSVDVVFCVKLHHGLDYQLAVGMSSGVIRIYLLPSKIIGQNKMLQKVDVKDLHYTSVLCVEWSTNGMKLFSGDKNGRIVVTGVDFYADEFKSDILLEEVNSDSEINQISYDHKAVLVSTKYRSIVCRTDEDSNFVQIGQRERKLTGNFGACFIPGLCKPSDAKLYAARPGCRVWHADIDGTVNNTYIFKDVFSETHPTIPVITPETIKPGQEDSQFGKLLIYRENEIVTWNGSNLFIIEPLSSQILGVQSRMGDIIDLAINKDEIFVLRKNTEISLIRLALKPEETKRTLHIPLSLSTTQPKNSNGESQTHTIFNSSKFNEELKQKGQSAKGFFQKNVIGKFKNLNFKPESNTVHEETSVKALTELSEDSSGLNTPNDQSPELPPVVKLKTPDLTGLKVFVDRIAESPSPEKKCSDMPDSTFNNMTIQMPPLTYDHTTYDHSTSAKSSYKTTEPDVGDIVFSQKVKKHKIRKRKTDKTKDKDDSDDKISGKNMTNSLVEQDEHKSFFHASDASSSNGKGLDALRRADDILERSLAVLNAEEMAKTSVTTDIHTASTMLENRDVLKQVPCDKSKLDKDSDFKSRIENNASENKPETKNTVETIKTHPIPIPELVPSTSQKPTKISESKISIQTAERNSLIDDEQLSLSHENNSEKSVDDIYAIYTDSSCSSLPSPLSSATPISPEIEAYQSRPSVSSQVPRRLESVEGKMDFTVNIFEEIATGANTYSLSVSETHVWFTDKSENIYYSNILGAKNVWRKAAGSASQIAVSPKGHIVWRLHRNIAYAGTTLTSKRPEGLKWVDAVKEVSYIAVDDSTAWYIKTDGNVMMQKELYKERPCFRSIRVPCLNNLKQLACHCGVVWAITDDMKLIYRNGITKACEEGTSWEFANCGEETLFFDHITLENNNGWAVDVLGRIWFVSDVHMETPMGSGKWCQVPINEYFIQDLTAIDNLKLLASKFDPQKLPYLISSNRGGLISVNTSGIWVCPEYKNILHVCRGNIQGFRWHDSPPQGISTSTAWKHVCADILDHDWGLVWAQQPNGDVYTFPPTNRSGSMVASSPMMICFSACEEAVWGLTQDGEVLARVGMGPFCPQGSSWMSLNLSQLGDAHLIHLCCNNQYIWAVDADGMIYQRIGSKAPTDQELSPVWLPLDSFSGIAFNHIAVGYHDWMVWATDNRRLAYVRVGISYNLPIGKEWRNVPGIQVVKLAISKTGVWAINAHGEIFYRYGITESNVFGDYWKKIPGLGRFISVSPNDELWIVSTEGKLLQCHSKFLQRRDKVDTDTLRSRSVGSDEGEWELV